ncbi:MAG: hypothetical protein J5697_03365 [Clostridia bacterium]|nr:hypothetical protein [Clostridia bacterium]
MKKPLKITLISILIFVLLAGATLTLIYLLRPKGQRRDEIDVTPNENAYIDDNTKNIIDCSPTESLFILANNLKKTNYYSSTISGEVDAGGIYKQTIGGEKYRSGESFLYVSRSTSWLKKTANQIFIENGTVLVRNGDADTNVYEDTAAKYTLIEYLNEYGTDCRELTNYELNESTIKSAELVSESDGIYTYRYEINVETAVDAYRVNMYKMGGLSELPTFYKSTLEVSMTENFMPVSVKQIDEYTVNMFLTLNCRSSITERFEKLNDDSVVIPEYEFFGEKLGG